jgi:type IV pilus assembly protein PilQ
MISRSPLFCNLRSSGLALVLALTSMVGLAQVAVQAISATAQAGQDVIKIDLSAPLRGTVNGYSIQSPARLVIDIPGAKSSLALSKVEVEQGSVRSINVVEVSDRTRLVVNLNRAGTHTITTSGNSILVTILAPTGAALSAQKPSAFAESLNENVLTIGNIDFRRSTEGVGRVEVMLPNNQIGVDIKQAGNNLVVEFLKATIAPALRRKLDVTDFATPVQSVTTTVVGDRVRMVIEGAGNWEHSAFQNDTKLVVEVRPQQVDPNKVSQGSGYTGEKITLNFQSIEVRALLQVIADFTNFNIITSDTVTGNVTLRLKDVPWDQALDIILQTKSLGMRRSGSVLWIAPKEELAAKEKQELEALAALQNLEALTTQSFQLNYTKAVDIAAQLAPTSAQAGGASKGVLSARGSVVAEPRTNQIFVTDIASRLVQVQQMINKLDVAVRQVLIEARIVEAKDTFGKSLGVKWGGADLGGVRGGQAGDPLGSSGQRIAFGGTYDAVSGTTGQRTDSTAALSTVNTQLISLPAVGQGGYSPSSIAVSLFSGVAGRFLNLELSALEADGKGKIVSSPRVVTADQTKALIEQGTELPYQVATASGATSIAFRKANLRLEVTPQITPEGNVILDLDVNKDSVGQSTAAGLAIDTKHIKTQVLVENGGTVVIGGIFEIEEKDNETKVPVLGDLPVVGNAFKAKTRSSSKTEMLVFITPKIISGQAVR